MNTFGKCLFFKSWCWTVLTHLHCAHDVLRYEPTCVMRRVHWRRRTRHGWAALSVPVLWLGAKAPSCRQFLGKGWIQRIWYHTRGVWRYLADLALTRVQWSSSSSDGPWSCGVGKIQIFTVSGMCQAMSSWTVCQPMCVCNFCFNHTIKKTHGWGRFDFMWCWLPLPFCWSSFCQMFFPSLQCWCWTWEGWKHWTCCPLTYITHTTCAQNALTTNVKKTQC